MVKVASSDILGLLRRFELASDEHVPRHIENVKYFNPLPSNTVVAFRFHKTNFLLLIDEAADDDAQYIKEQMHKVKADVVGEILENPRSDMRTYGMPFKGKSAYLFELLSDKKRLDVIVAERYPETSRSTWQKYIKAGHVRVNGTVILSPKHETSEFDVIAITPPEDIDFSQHQLPIIYIDDNVIVINKPAGVLTHAKGALSDEFTVAEFFRPYTTFAKDTNRPGIVHRLDRDTSGVLIGARNPETAHLLQKQFAERHTKKTYLAVVSGIPKNPEAKVELPIARHPSSPGMFRVDPKGKSASTTYEVLAVNDHNQALIRLRPYTGRTHQLRVHMQYLGTPIVGDRLYNPTPADRLFLHAVSLEITIPEGERRTFVTPVPVEFTNLFTDASL